MKATKVIDPITGIVSYLDAGGQAITDPVTLAAIDAACADECETKPDAVVSKCFEITKTTKVGYQVSDFDSGDLQIGDPATCQFSVTVVGGRSTSASADNAAYSVAEASVDTSQPGQTTVNYTASFAWDGGSNPGVALSAEIESEGCTGTLTGSDFFLCSGGGESVDQELVGKQRLKEFCFIGEPSVYQNDAGEVVDVSELTPCPDTLDDILASQEASEGKLCALADLIKQVPDACAQSAVIGWCGRPAEIADYAYGDISAASLPDFNAAWEASGGKTWIAAEDGITGGECHWFCPAIPGATFTINGVEPGNGNVVVSPNPNAEALGCEPYDALTTCSPGIESLLSQLIANQADANELADANLAKACLIEDNTNPAGGCPADVPPEGLDKEALTLTLKGDVTANYPADQSINLMNANGESCGEATASGVNTYDAETDLTVVTITECVLDEGKTPVQVTQAKPVTKLVVAAIKTVKAFAVKKLAVRTVATTPTRG